MYSNVPIMYIILFLYFILNMCRGEDHVEDICQQHKTCNECISDPRNCTWCAMETLKNIRCKSVYSENWCHNQLKNPKSWTQIKNDKPFSSDLKNIVQIKPQEYNMKLRIGEEVTFNFSYKAAEDYPVDIHFLIDASLSMYSIKSDTANQSESVYKTVSQLTSNVLLGFSTFIDKNALPYTEFVDKNLTYSFRNQLKLTNSYKVFKDTLTNSPFGQNYDLPEGGLDALAQVIVCTEEIGWRNQSRKIVVFLTDGAYHAAGDGELAGIDKPYDGGCYTKNGVYLNELKMDYPSVGIINKLAKEREIVILFSVPQNIHYVYKILSNAILNSKTTTYGSNTMAEVIKDIYKEITDNIKFDIRTPYEKNIAMTFQPDCYRKRSKKCKVKTGQQKNFVGTIKLLENVKTKNFSVDILVEGITETLTLNIEVLNECDCKNDFNSKLCNRNGNRTCGICECNPGRYGDSCECTVTSGSSTSDNTGCKAPNHTEICSGHGICYCGKCQCSQRYVGDYCECNQDNCPRVNGDICSNHGRCDCGKCTCDGDWSGDACNCFKGLTPCTFNGKECNNRGKCVCGMCQCDPMAMWDVRKHQDDYCWVTPCADCHTLQCRALAICAQCHQSGKTDCPDCEQLTIKLTNTSGEITTDGADWKTCYTTVKGICHLRFMYRYNTTEYGIEVIVFNDLDCAESYYIFGGVFLACFILIGLITMLAWKLLTDAQDRREYDRFKKERETDMAETHVNPYFRPPTMVFSNPAFRKRSVS